MIGRAALGRPWFFEEIYCLLTGRHYHPPSREEIREILEWHFQELSQQILRNDPGERAEAGACRKFLSHLNKYLSGYPGWKVWRRRSSELNTRKKLLHAVDRVLLYP